ncbi:integron [Salinarimonas chemoclinalis]|uniref:integron n=1 Tax=Salinarimonas chemoclinalis TaxID=3241599 RepID=UPI0035561E03
MDRTTLIACVALAGLLTLPLPAGGQGRIDVPVEVGGDGFLDGCWGIGQVVGLDPNGDGFLSVRSGPGGRQYREIDRVHNGQQVAICGEDGPWYAVVYSRTRDTSGCGVHTPWPVRQPYTGPCEYGWVHSRYVHVVAG